MWIKRIWLVLTNWCKIIVHTSNKIFYQMPNDKHISLSQLVKIKFVHIFWQMFSHNVPVCYRYWLPFPQFLCGSYIISWTVNCNFHNKLGISFCQKKSGRNLYICASLYKLSSVQFLHVVLQSSLLSDIFYDYMQCFTR